MKKKKRITKKITATLVASVSILVASAIMLAHLFLAFCCVQYAKCGATELYRINSLSPEGSPETLDEMLANIKSEYSDGSWAFRIASANTDKATSFVVVSALILAVIASSIAILVELQIKEKKRKKRKAAKKAAARKAVVEKVAAEKAAKAEYQRRMRDIMLDNYGLTDDTSPEDVPDDVDLKFSI